MHDTQYIAELNARYGYLCGLPSVAIDQWRSLPSVPALYFVFSMPGIVLYIGRTKNLRARWGNNTPHHHRFDALSQIKDVRIYYLAVDAEFTRDAMVQVERWAIQHFRPLYNLTNNPDRWRIAELGYI